MAKAVARVEQKIIITGADNASDAIKKAQRSLGGLQKQAKKTAAVSKDFGKDFAEAGDQVAGRAGKLSTALSSLGDFAGQSEGKFRQASEAAGAFDDVLTLLPGPIGLAGAAVAGLTTVLVLQQKAAAQAEAKLRQAFGGQTLADIRAIKEGFDLSADAAVELGNALAESGQTTADVRDELTNVVLKAEEVGEDGSAAVSKFAASLTRGVTEAQRLTNRVKALGLAVQRANLQAAASGSFVGDFAGAAGQAADKNLASLADKLKTATQNLRDLERGTKGPLANLKQSQGFVASMATTFGLSTKLVAKQNQAWKAQKSAIGAASDEVQRLRDAITEADAKRSQVAETLKEVAAQDKQLRIEEAATEAQEVAAENQRQARSKARANRAKARAAQARRQREREKQAAFGLARQLAGIRALLQLQRNELETEDLLAQAKKATAGTTAELIAAEKQLLDVSERRQVLEIENAELSDDEKKARIAAVKQLARAELTERIKAISTNAAAARKARKEERAKELAEAHADLVAAAQPLFDATAALNQAAGQLGSTGLAQLASSLQVAAQGALDLKKNLGDTPKAAGAVAGAVGNIATIAIDAEQQRTQQTLQAEKDRQLATASSEAERARIVADFEQRKAKSVEAAERRKAGILALMELARAAAAFPNIPQVAAHVAAAGLFGAVAGGVVGTGSAAAPSAGGGGFTAQAGAGQGGSQQGQQGAGQGVTIINNFNQPLVTRQHIGKAVQGALRSIGTTGHAKAKGV